MVETHSDYDYNIEYWQQIRTFVRGKKEVQNYLQNVVSGTDAESIQRNKDYKARAKYVNFTSRTQSALVGAVFSKEAEVKLPTTLEYMLLNADGTGKSLEQISKVCVSNIIQVGRHGLLSSYDVVKKIAKLTTYTAENIINWTEDESGNLDSVVLFVKKDVYKHLKLIDGAYTVEIRNEANELLEDVVHPTKADGSKFNHIPFTIVGSEDNSPKVDDAPMWSIVDVSQGHLQNSADYEDMLRILQPTPWANNIDKQYMNDMYPSGFIPFGSGSMIVLPKDSQAGLIQPSENQMISQAMRHKEELLIMLGARLISNSGQAETAEAVRIKYSADSSVILNLVGNVSRAIEQGLEWCAEFMGSNEEQVIYILNRQLFDMKLSPQEISALVLLGDRGFVAKQDIRRNLRNSDVLAQDRTDEMIDGEIEDSGNGLA